MIFNFKKYSQCGKKKQQLKKKFLETFKRVFRDDFESVIMSFAVFLLYVEGSAEDCESNMFSRKCPSPAPA